MTEPPKEPLSRVEAYPKVPLSQLLEQARSALIYAISSAESNAPICIFFSMSDGAARATVVHFSGPDLESIWEQLRRWLAAYPKSDPLVRWLRVDWVSRSWQMSWKQARQAIQSSKRNYFRYGISLDLAFSRAFLEQELNANAMLYLGNHVEHAGLNLKNFGIYGKRRFGKGFELPSSEEAPVYLFATEAFFLQADQPPKPLYGFEGGVEGRDTGRRKVAAVDEQCVLQLIDESSRFLAEQIDEKGRFIYGLHPCFDREINSYNTLRHASTLYSMLEAWEVTGDIALKQAIDRALGFLTETLVRYYDLPNGSKVAYLQDVKNEIKLGGSAVCILALVKYTELTSDRRHMALLDALALGISYLQNRETGQLAHVLNADDLTVKDTFRVIYYDGEAAFGLMRLYELTKDDRWLAVVEKAFEYFIAQDHWKIHDHWLGYCVNELTRYRPEERYFQFGLKNIVGHLDFVIERITTFPTLLELMMASHKMVVRLERSAEHRHLIKQLDKDKFYRALETRAQYMLNGFFWPEIAMFFKHPARILGSFFIRHHAFRVRIDDVEHYLSGYVAYLRHYLERRDIETNPPAEELSRSDVPKEYLPRPAQATLVIGGGVNLGGRVHDRAAQLGAGQVVDIPPLKAADLSIVSLDCVVSTLGTQGTDKGEQGPFYRRARPEMIAVLADAGIDVVTVANSHSGDYGPAALMQQQDILDAVGIANVGSGRSREEAFRPAICHVGELRIALFSLDTAQPRFSATATDAGTAYLSSSDVAQWQIELEPRFATAAREADLVFVSIHWGAHSNAQRQEEISHALIDVGADAVFGNGGRGLPNVEIYKTKPILRGLGSLLSDALHNEVKTRGVFRLGLSHGGVDWVEFVPVGVGYGFSECLRGDAAQRAVEDFRLSCGTLGASVSSMGGTALIEIASVQGGEPRATKALRKEKRLDLLKSFAPAASYGQASHVPQDACIKPFYLNGLTLLGVRVKPSLITRREMLWVETWWGADMPIDENLKLEYRAVPGGGENSATWGLGSGHDPCDWMQPTRHWQTGKIYYDRFGLRPPALEKIHAPFLQLEIRVTGRNPNTKCYLHPKPLSVRLSN
ncbi:CapA family protein [Celeribacter halophilus]|uniref:CapA family protein n=1 Tax=Celeribacter halophilus TaxID=576117 RepID=UPI0026E29977|nr:CapA family protein [Celeribacter halophilus]MDO6724732.1 CapA family protein [Celeribacter halophilus]